MAEIAIKLDHVSKNYSLYKNERERFKAALFGRGNGQKIRAVRNVSLEIQKGEAVAILGKNGSGKSTLLKMIAGVTYPSSGTIDVDGKVSALLELTTGFDPELTGEENVAFRGELIGLGKPEIEKLVRKVARFAQLGKYLDQPVRTYSSGMKARLGFAINVHLEPDVLIVDEALSVGDLAFRVKCLDKVRDLIENHGVTFVCVTHSAEIAQEFCKRGIILKDGKVKFDGKIDEAIDLYDEMLLNTLALKSHEKGAKKQSASGRSI